MPRNLNFFSYIPYQKSYQQLPSNHNLFPIPPSSSAISQHALSPSAVIMAESSSANGSASGPTSSGASGSARSSVGGPSRSSNTVTASFPFFREFPNEIKDEI
jgi:hypothetical protein